MHMADAPLSAAVGGTMWAVSAGIAAYSARKLAADRAEHRAPLMGVLGAFVFAAQMVNFAIPGTGSSGHLGGGLLLAILLGPYAAFLVMFSILTVQALFFADGGILALGCNVFNMGFWPCFLAYPLIFKSIVANRPTSARIMTGATAGGIAALLLGSAGVAVETFLSGKSELPLGGFLTLMLSIHFLIGIVEGLATAALVSFIWKARPEALEFSSSSAPKRGMSGLLITVLIAALLTGGFISWYASSKPDGLEWAIEKITGKTELTQPAGQVHEAAAALQSRTAVFPDYNFRNPANNSRAGNALSGIIGGGLVIALAGIAGWIIRISRKPRKASSSHG